MSISVLFLAESVNALHQTQQYVCRSVIHLIVLRERDPQYQLQSERERHCEGH